MKQKVFAVVGMIIFSLLIILSGCNSNIQKAEEWGSFTPEKAFSYDNQLYAVQAVEEVQGVSHVVVSVYVADSDEMLFSFAPARAMDFWGICWEKDTYNIWIQSGDVGVLCYKYNDNQWQLDQSAIRPDYILSKYD